MKKLFLALLLLGGCASSPPQTKLGNAVLLYQSNRWGEMEPCGCQSNPNGGLDREANAIAIENRETLFYVDAGNTLAPPLKKTTKAHQTKAKALLEILETMGLDVFAPGPDDLKLGLDALKALASGSKVKFVGTNLVDKSKNAFAPFVVVEKNGAKWAFLSVTPEGGVATNPEAALKRWVPEAQKKASFLVLLSQLNAEGNEKLAEQFPDLRVIVGSDAKLSLDEPLWVGGTTLLVNPGVRGQTLGKLQLEVNEPFKGFYSDEIIRRNRVRLFEWERKKTKESLFLAERMRKYENISPVLGGTRFKGELIKLDKERFGKANAVTKAMATYRESVRTAALSE